MENHIGSADSEILCYGQKKLTALYYIDNKKLKLFIDSFNELNINSISLLLIEKERIIAINTIACQ